MLDQALRETIRIQDGRIPLLDRHLARLKAGGCDAHIIEAARVAALDAAAQWPADYGRMTLLVSPHGEVSAEVTDRSSTIQIEGGPAVAVVESEVPTLPPGAAKPADRSFWDEALHRAQELGADVALLADHDGRLIDGSQATLWLVTSGELATPPSPPALAGVSRGVVFDIARLEGMPASERALTRADLDTAEEVFLTTAVAGAVAVRGRGGAVTDTIADRFGRLLGGEPLQ